MYKIAYVLFCAIVFIACHKKEDPADCEPRVCTEEFRSLLISFTDKDGKGVAVKDYSVINMSTGQLIKTRVVASLTLVAGTFVVIDDSQRGKVSAAGDELKITGTYETTGQTKSAIVKVSGGKCACHIEKISGPEKIVFD